MSISKKALAYGIKMHGTAKFSPWCNAMAVTGEVSKADDAKTAVEAAVKANKASVATLALNKSLSGLKVSPALAKLAKTNPGSIIRVAIVGNKVSFAVASPKAKGSKGSCMSAKTAIEVGNKKGDAIVFSKVEALAKATVGLSQRAILFRDYPGSHAVAKLKQYGYTG